MKDARAVLMNVSPVLVIALAAGAASAQCEPRWERLGATIGLDGGVNAITSYFETSVGDSLYVGGSFTQVVNTDVNRIARWDGSTWSGLGSGIPAFTHSIFGCCARVLCLEPLNERGRMALYVGGDFIQAGGLTVESIARYRADTFFDLAGGLQNNQCFDCGPRVHDILADYTTGPTLYMIGTFTGDANGSPLSRVAKWDGSAWSSLGTGIEELPGDPNPYWGEALAFYNAPAGRNLVICGRFGRVGGVECHDVAEWDGLSWRALGSGLASSIPGRVTAAKAMAVFDDGTGEALYVAGEFDLAGGVTVSNIAKWDGQQWHDVGGGTDAQILTLLVHDDGSGPALYAGGQFTTAGGQPADHIARWTGSAWEPLRGGVDGEVQALHTWDNGSGSALYVGGWFNNVDGQPSPYFAAWHGCANVCYADCDTSTGIEVLDIFDFLCFQNRFAAGTPYACDCDTTTGAGICDIFDFLCFQNAFSQGCR